MCRESSGLEMGGGRRPLPLFSPCCSWWEATTGSWYSGMMDDDDDDDRSN